MALGSKYTDIIIIGENTNGIATSDLQARLDDATFVFEKKGKSLVWKKFHCHPKKANCLLYNKSLAYNGGMTEYLSIHSF